MVPDLVRNRTTLVWLGLVAATLASWSLGVGHELADGSAGVLILLIAFVKVRFVGRYFMELRTAPVVLIAVFEIWTAVVATVLIGLFLFAR